MVWTKVEPAPEIVPVAQETLAAMVVVVSFELLLLPQAPATSAITAINAAGTAFVRSVLRELGPEGFATTVAATVDEALARLAEAGPHVALVDACLPGGGREACTRLRAASSLPIIVAPSAGGADELVEYL